VVDLKVNEWILFGAEKAGLYIGRWLRVVLWISAVRAFGGLASYDMNSHNNKY